MNHRATKLKQIIEIVQTLSDLPDADARAESGQQFDALVNRFQGRVENAILAGVTLVLEIVLVMNFVPVDLRLVLV